MGRGIRPLCGVTLEDAFVRSDRVVSFPQLSEADKQWIELEKQRDLIREQAKLIAEKEQTL